MICTVFWLQLFAAALNIDFSVFTLYTIKFFLNVEVKLHFHQSLYLMLPGKLSWVNQVHLAATLCGDSNLPLSDQ